MLHAASRVGDEATKIRCLKALDGSVDDLLCCAALKYADHDYADAINIYRQIIYDDRCPHARTHAV